MILWRAFRSLRASSALQTARARFCKQSAPPRRKTWCWSRGAVMKRCRTSTVRMCLFSLREAAALIPDARIIGDASVRFERVSTDSRTVAPGELFVALKGERFDAHDFLPEAVKRGAVAALVSRDFPEILLPALKAPDTCAALGLLARGWR